MSNIFHAVKNSILKFMPYFLHCFHVKHVGIDSRCWLVRIPRVTSHPDWVFLFPSVPPCKCRNNTWSRPPPHIFSSSSVTFRPYIFLTPKPSLNNPQPHPHPRTIFSICTPYIRQWTWLPRTTSCARQWPPKAIGIVNAHVLAICDVTNDAAIVFSQVEHKHVVRQQSGLSVVAVDKETGFAVI